MSVPGRLITMEGIDGVGKTTHVQRVVAELANRGLPVTTYREPGATPLGEALRQLLKQGVAQSAAAELLLFATARAELVAVHVRPELEAGHWVVLDRFTESTLAYQGALDQIPEDVLAAVCRAAAGGLTPDLTLWLDLSPEQAAARRYPLEQALNSQSSAVSDAFEQRSLEYFRRVRERYLALQQAAPDRIMRIDAGGSIEETAALVRQAVEEKLEQWSSAGSHV